MRVLVTGGNRFVGLRLVLELHRLGHEVTVINSHPAPYPEGVRRVHAVRADRNAFAAALASIEVEAVFDNTAYNPDDVRPVLARFGGRLRQYLFTSSIAAYRVSDLQPIHEHFATEPDPAQNVRGPYGAGKAQAENLLFDLHQREGLPVTILRFAHVYGPNNAIPGREPSYFARLEQGRPCIVPGDGLPQLHIVHVDDVADAMVAALGNRDAIGEAFTLAGPEAISYNGLMRAYGRSAGIEPNVIHIDRALGLSDRRTRDKLSDWNEWEIGSRIFDLTKANERLGWQPQRHIAEAMPATYAWFRDGGREQFSFDWSFDNEILARS
ncbi:MAG: NAD-dependent epimerase/dehydratase family protein [Dehalococcoidia bacterium]